MLHRRFTKSLAAAELRVQKAKREAANAKSVAVELKHELAHTQRVQEDRWLKAKAQCADLQDKFHEQAVQLQKLQLANSESTAASG